MSTTTIDEDQFEAFAARRLEESAGETETPMDFGGNPQTEAPHVRIDKTCWPYRRYTTRRDGVEKVEVFTFGNTGKTIHGESAAGHFKPLGFRKGKVFSRTFKGLKAKLLGDD